MTSELNNHYSVREAARDMRAAYEISDIDQRVARLSGVFKELENIWPGDLNRVINFTAHLVESKDLLLILELQLEEARTLPRGEAKWLKMRNIISQIIEKQGDLEKAVEIAKEIGEGPIRDLTLHDIFRAFLLRGVLLNTHKAANMLSNGLIKDSFLWSTAQACLQRNNPIEARKAAEMIFDVNLKDSVLWDLALFYMDQHYDIDAASVAREIRNVSLKEYLIGESAQGVNVTRKRGRPPLRNLIEITLVIPDDEERIARYSNLFKGMVFKSSQEFSDMLRNVKNQGVTSRDIALVLIKNGHISEAVEYANSITVASEKEEILWEIAKALMLNGNTIKALYCITLIPDRQKQKRAFQEILNRVLEEVLDIETRSLLLHDMAQYLIQSKELKIAVDFAQAIPDPERQCALLLAIAAAYEKKGHIESAAGCLERILDPVKRESLILDLFYRASEQGRREEVIALAQKFPPALREFLLQNLPGVQPEKKRKLDNI